MENPYFALHKEFKAAGANVLLSSGQACVLLGIAAFSKDGDWIVREDTQSCSAILRVLATRKAVYRLGAPLDIRFLTQGWSSHFEFFTDGLRVRTDFVSRPPRIPDPSNLWARAASKDEIDLVAVEDVIKLKQTRRPRDYAVIGALAEVCGFNEHVPSLALSYLQDYDLLRKAVEQWHEEAQRSDRDAVKKIVSGAPRRDVVIALALEQDENVEEDNRRIALYKDAMFSYQRVFAELSSHWKIRGTPLSDQHRELIALAENHLQPPGRNHACV